MAINVTSTSNANPVQLNLRETRANRVEQRSAQTADTRRAEQASRAEKEGAALKQRVKENTDASRTEARNNDEAAAADRRAVQQSDKKADTQRRDNEKTLGRNIDTTA
ncbi:hypothetical protein GJ697_19235 [Pseudoduganella sp. FT25W]|jgi:hypothetical protein|uniref:Uncharacterized protein n=1 Tax=Duganella alba TaxID=2666081 RepID=A0A6L5QJK8_9BURK|nr:hypothetical protein [Duganella alba]MRX09976.1 hypothetical protein [Duganella alba]MRX17829.1 hypothetical protein [Duganella alba]